MNFQKSRSHVQIFYYLRPGLHYQIFCDQVEIFRWEILDLREINEDIDLAFNA